MQQTIFVGNLPFSTTEAEIHNLFSQFGTVLSVKLIADRETGRPRGFGFVGMEDAEAAAAIDALNDMEFNGRPLRVNKAEERAPREDRGNGGFRGPRENRGDRRPPRRY